jgi:hypothetical protein
VPRLFTRIECGVFGVGWADQPIAAVKTSTADPASAFGKSTFSPTVFYLAQFAPLREGNLRTHSPAKTNLAPFAPLREILLRNSSPAKHVLSNVEGTLSSQRPLRLTNFPCGPYLDFSEVGEPFDGVYPELSRRAQDMLCTFARE